MSPQFQVIFDDHFYTVYGDGTNKAYTDAIVCTQLWDLSHKLYVDDEFGPDGTLIYSPPLLDKVWLDKEGQHDCQQRLLDQHQHHEHQAQSRMADLPVDQYPDPPPIGIPGLLDYSSSDVDFGLEGDVLGDHSI